MAGLLARIQRARRQPFHAMTPDLARIADYLLGGLSGQERATLSRATAKIIERIAEWQEA